MIEDSILRVPSCLVDVDDPGELTQSIGILTADGKCVETGKESDVTVENDFAVEFIPFSNG